VIACAVACDCSTDGKHRCQLEAGHQGPHKSQYFVPRKFNPHGRLRFRYGVDEHNWPPEAVQAAYAIVDAETPK
jgi:hypothetical protein